MRMDHTQRGWALGSFALLAISAVAYVIYVLQSPAGPSGGSFMGLVFGITGFAFMIFAALLGARKRVPTWRVGRAQAWMRGHLWLGLLSLPMILFHGGFHFGGTLTINWHDRSVAPERLWGGCYRDLIQDLKSRGAWFSTATQAISWFRKRRSAAFETDSIEPGAVRAEVTVERRDDLPGLQLRIHKAGKLGEIGAHRSEDYVGLVVDERIDTGAPSEAKR